ncbi:hypothetical protein NFI96_000093 [Prochilodus magdalenae]|nr:hypothetical protein NFI96_000093 [Prochilodus magdalenae]
MLLGTIGLVLCPVGDSLESTCFIPGSSKEDQREVILKELVEIWRKGGGWYPRREQPSSGGASDQQIRSVVRGIVGSLKSLGLFPKKAVPPLDKPLDRNRLSGFLYNISTYLQEMSAELDDGPSPFGDDQFWENLLLSFLQSDGRTPPGQWDGRVPPRPSFKLQDLFLSLRGSPHWDGLLGLVQSILTLIERQPQKPILTFVSQHWKTISALLDTVLQTLVSGTYGQASAGLQGFICVLNGRSDCAFNLSWLQQLLTFLETKNWKPVVNLHPAGVAADHRDGALSTGRFKPFSVPPEVLREENLYVSNGSRETESLSTMQKLLLQALSRSNVGERAVQFAENNPALLQGLDGLRRGLLHRVGNTVYSNLKRKVSRVTMALLDDLGSMVEEPQSSHQGRCSVGKLIPRLFQEFVYISRDLVSILTVPIGHSVGVQVQTVVHLFLCVLYYPVLQWAGPPQDHHRADTPTLLVHLVDGQSETIAHLLLHSAVLVIL